VFENFTERTRKVLLLARQEAQRLDQGAIGTEHLLLGILGEGLGVAARVLKDLQIDPARIRLELDKRMLRGALPAPPGALPYTPECKRAIELAGAASEAMGQLVIGTQHLLLGLIREREGIAAQVLMGLGLDGATIQDQILRVLETKPARLEEQDLQPRAVAIRPLTDRPSVQEPLTELLQQGKSVALVGPKRVGKTSIVLAMARAKAAGLSYRSVDHRMFDEFQGTDFSAIRRPDSVCLVTQAELLTVSRSMNANLLEDRMVAGERLVLEFRDGDLEKFAARYSFIAKQLVPVEVKPPGPDESRQLLESARRRLKEMAGIDMTDDLLQETDRLARDRWRLLVPPWPTIMTLWTAESIHRETSARGDEEQLLKDIADLDKAGDRDQAEALKRHLEGLRSIAGTNALSIESVRRAIGELSGPSQ
jgi:hypothetical protein